MNLRFNNISHNIIRMHHNYINREWVIIKVVLIIIIKWNMDKDNYSQTILNSLIRTHSLKTKHDLGITKWQTCRDINLSITFHNTEITILNKCITNPKLISEDKTMALWRVANNILVVCIIKLNFKDLLILEKSIISHQS